MSASLPLGPFPAPRLVARTAAHWPPLASRAAAMPLPPKVEAKLDEAKAKATKAALKPVQAGAKVFAKVGGGLKKVVGEERTNKFLANAAKDTKRTHRWLIQLEGKWAFLLNTLPVAGPLTAALFCTYLLIFQDLQPPVDSPWLFQLSLLFCLGAVVGWLLLQV